MTLTGAGIETLPVAPALSILDWIGDVTPDQLPCRWSDPDLFFAEAPADVEQAKSLCGTCPVQAACLASALARKEPWGVWGGQLFVNGGVVARKRPRGRPRKHPATRAADEAAA